MEGDLYVYIIIDIRGVRIEDEVQHSEAINQIKNIRWHLSTSSEN